MTNGLISEVSASPCLNNLIIFGHSSLTNKVHYLIQSEQPQCALPQSESNMKGLPTLHLQHRFQALD